MAVLYLAHLVGGDILPGLVSALAFTTTLAVVAGLTMSAASAVSYDLYANVMRRGEDGEGRELAISRVATVCIGVLAIALGLAFAQQNIAYTVGLAFGVAAAANFPVLVLAMYWSKLTTLGAIVGGAVGLVGSVVLTVIGPSIWVRTLGFTAPIFPYDPPTIVTLPLALVACWLVSVMDRSEQGALDRAGFLADPLEGGNATPAG